MADLGAQGHSLHAQAPVVRRGRDPEAGVPGDQSARQGAAIVDDGFALYESNAICEYLEEQYPQKPLLPKDAKGRALVRRLIGEADDSLYKLESDLMDQVLYRPAAERDPKQIGEAKAKLREELAYWRDYLKGDFFAGPLSLADFAIYPYLRMSVRIEERAPASA
ncbi:MAG: glutathione S-transferase family protein [Rhizobiales bacterium]|nr:glutathione S-transferase family protein [Hyphomicrobiales bacterium]